MLGSQRSHWHEDKIMALMTAARASGKNLKDERQVQLAGIGRSYWMGI